MPRPLQSQVQRRSLCAHHQAFSLGSKMTNTTHVNEGMKVLHRDINFHCLPSLKDLIDRYSSTFSSVLSAGLGGWGWGTLYPKSSSIFSAAFLLATFLLGPIPSADWPHTVTYIRKHAAKNWTGEQLTSKGRGKQAQCYWNASVSVKSPAWRTPCAEVDLSLSPCCILVPSPSWPAESEPGDWWDSFPGHILDWSAAVGVTD